MKKNFINRSCKELSNTSWPSSLFFQDHCKLFPLFSFILSSAFSRFPYIKLCSNPSFFEYSYKIFELTRDSTSLIHLANITLIYYSSLSPTCIHHTFVRVFFHHTLLVPTIFLSNAAI